MSNIQIILDCPPGINRPDNILEMLLTATELKTSDFNIISKVFGSWTFELAEDKKEIYEKYEDAIIIKIKKVYANGLIRYAEW